MADFMNDEERREHREVVIEDLRHRRDAGEAEELSESDVTTPTPDAELADSHAEVAEPAVADPIPVYGDEGRIDAAVEAGLEDGDPGDLMADSLPPGITEEDIRAAEREQLRQLIGLGVVNYLRYQLSMIYNFAVINLGGMVDPASGIARRNLAHARIAIDVFEHIVARIEHEMQPGEREELKQLIQQVKFAYAQALAEELSPEGGAPEA